MNIFNTILQKKPKKNWFDMSHEVKLSCNMGKLIPVMMQDCVPGDKWKLSNEALVRFQPLVAPMMHRVNVKTTTWFVPYRILWDGWEEWITNTNLANEFPYFSLTAGGTYMGVGDLADYLGIPVSNNYAPNEALKFNAMPFAAYTKIYWDYFRDQNLIDVLEPKLANGLNNGQWEDFADLRRIAWEHDYFTAALPWAQKGDPVLIPFAGDVVLKDAGINQKQKIKQSSNGAGVLATSIYSDADAELNATIGGSANNDVVIDPNGSLEVVNGQSTINDLRRAYKIQEWAELAARGGSRLKETIWNFFGVQSPDSRLQRAEYICGSVTPLSISEVLNTTGTETAPQGTMAGHGVSVVNGNSGEYYVQEHGIIMTLLTIVPKPAYTNSLEKLWLKTEDPFQYYWPQFANIGEQEVDNSEVYAFNPNAGETFGYVPRYSEFKYANNRVAGEFRTNLNHWHMSREFAAPPALNQEFIECNPTKRVFAVEDPAEHEVLVNIYNKCWALRGMPKFGIPSI